MNKNKKLKYLFIIIMLILCTSAVYKFNINKININKIFVEVSNNNLDIISNKKEILDLVESIKKESNNKVMIAKLYYIESYIKYNEKSYDASINKLNQALSKIQDKKNYSKIEFEIYKLKYLNYIKLKDIKKVEANFQQILILTEKYRLYDEFIKLCLNSSSKLLELDEGTNLACRAIDESIALLDKIKDSKTKIKLLELASNIYMFKEQLDVSLKYLLQALDICVNKNVDDKLRLSILIDISVNYILQERYEEAIKISKSILEFKDLDYTSEIDMLSYISVAYVELEKYDEAEKSLNILMDKLEKDTKSDKNLREANKIWVYIAYADLYTKIGKYEKSETYLEKLSEIYPKYKEISFLGTDTNILIEYGDLYYKLGEYQKALGYHQKAYEIFKSRHIEKGLSVLLQSISDDYYKLGEYQKSYELLKDINTIYDKELKKINYDKFNNVYNSILLEEKMEKVDTLNKNKKVMKYIILLLLIISIMGYINIRIVKKKKEKIKKLNDKLQEQTLKDALTGLYNRKGLREYIEDFEYVKNVSVQYAFFMMDIDCFKLYNDNYGHIKGDDVLYKVSNCLKEVAGNHFVARYGGEEFILIMKYKDEYEIEELAQNLQERIKLINIEHKYSLVSDHVTLSIGSCNGRFKKEEISNIINQADIALYNSKANGRNRYTNIKFKSSLD